MLMSVLQALMSCGAVWSATGAIANWKQFPRVALVSACAMSAAMFEMCVDSNAGHRLLWAFGLIFLTLVDASITARRRSLFKHVPGALSMTVVRQLGLLVMAVMLITGSLSSPSTIMTSDHMSMEMSSGVPWVAFLGSTYVLATVGAIIPQGRSLRCRLELTGMALGMSACTLMTVA